MNHITMTIDRREIQITVDDISIGYQRFSHEDFNSIVAVYKAFGFYREVSLKLEQEVLEKAAAAVHEALELPGVTEEDPL
jgi:hypothetical protein